MNAELNVNNNVDQEAAPATIPDHSAADGYSSGFDDFVTNKAYDYPEADDVAKPEAQKPEEPEVKEEDSYSPESIDVDNPPEVLKDHPFYKSMKGRVDLERKRADELAARLRSAEEERRFNNQRRAEVEKAAIPEDMKEDIEAFKKQFPEFSDVIEMAGRDGEHARALLSEYGSTVAATHARAVVAEARARDVADSMSKQIGDYVGITHEQQVFAAHPDFAEMTPDKKGQFFRDMETWIDSLPRVQGNEMRRVFDHGSTRETIRLFAEFKKANQANINKTIQNNKRQQAISDGLAVPSSARGSMRTGGKFASADDYSGGFMEACRRK